MTEPTPDHQDAQETAQLCISVSCMTHSELARQQNNGMELLKSPERTDQINVFVIVDDDELTTAGLLLDQARRKAEDPRITADISTVAQTVSDINALCGDACHVLIGVGAGITDKHPIGATIAVEQIMAAIKRQQMSEQGTD